MVTAHALLVLVLGVLRLADAQECESPEYLTTCLQTARKKDLNLRCQEACEYVSFFNSCPNRRNPTSRTHISSVATRTAPYRTCPGRAQVFAAFTHLLPRSLAAFAALLLILYR